MTLNQAWIRAWFRPWAMKPGGDIPPKIKVIELFGLVQEISYHLRANGFRPENPAVITFETQGLQVKLEITQTAKPETRHATESAQG